MEAIRAGVQPGLTMVVGPPGTGKTDTAVQIMHVLYHNCPTQRTLLITHSNQARMRISSASALCLLQDLCQPTGMPCVQRIAFLFALSLHVFAHMIAIAEQGC